MENVSTVPNPIGHRLKYEMRKRGVTSTELARRAEVKTSFIYDVISGKSANPSTIKLARVAESLGVSLAYLAGYESAGPKPLSAQNENGEYVYIPLLTADIAVPHKGSTPAHAANEPLCFSRTWIRIHLQADVSSIRMMVVRGDSMEPTLCHNDVILVDTARKIPSPPGVFMVDDGFALVPKRLEYLTDQQPPMVRVMSDNPKYSSHECLAEDMRIAGRVVWFSRDI